MSGHSEHQGMMRREDFMIRFDDDDAGAGRFSAATTDHSVKNGYDGGHIAAASVAMVEKTPTPEPALLAKGPPENPHRLSARFLLRLDREVDSDILDIGVDRTFLNWMETTFPGLDITGMIQDNIARMAAHPSHLLQGHALQEKIEDLVQARGVDERGQCLYRRCVAEKYGSAHPDIKALIRSDQFFYLWLCTEKQAVGVLMATSVGGQATSKWEVLDRARGYLPHFHGATLRYAVTARLGITQHVAPISRVGLRERDPNQDFADAAHRYGEARGGDMTGWDREPLAMAMQEYRHGRVPQLIKAAYDLGLTASEVRLGALAPLESPDLSAADRRAMVSQAMR